MIDNLPDKNNLALKVVGIGGAGINAVNAMLASNLIDVEYLAVATSESALSCSNASNKVLFPSDGLIEQVKGVDVVILIVGMGGGTGTVITPILAAMAKDAGALVMALVMAPFASEGKARLAVAQDGIERLKSACDCMVVIPNDHLSLVSDTPLNLFDAFKVADDLIREVILALTEQGREYGDCCTDINLIRSILTKPGIAKVITGVAGGERRAAEAVSKALTSPLLNGTGIHTAAGLIISVAGSSNLTVEEFEEICYKITLTADLDAEVVRGMAICEQLEHQVKVTVIATGLKELPKSVNVNDQLPDKGFMLGLWRKLAIVIRLRDSKNGNN